MDPALRALRLASVSLYARLRKALGGWVASCSTQTHYDKQGALRLDRATRQLRTQPRVVDRTGDHGRRQRSCRYIQASATTPASASVVVPHEGCLLLIPRLDPAIHNHRPCASVLVYRTSPSCCSLPGGVRIHFEGDANDCAITVGRTKAYIVEGDRRQF